MAEDPHVTVVIPVFDDPDGLRRCTEALLDQTYRPDRVLVVVVDNGSTLDVAESMPNDPRFVLLHEPRPGSYTARNTAMAAATGEVLAFTDADCTPARDWLAEGIVALRASDCDAVGGAVRMTFRGDRPKTAPEIFESVEGFPQQRYIERDGFAVTANLFVRADAMRKVGPFDSSLRSGGDMQWCHRLRGCGGKLGYAPLALVEHPARTTWTDLGRKALRVGRGLAEHRGVGGKRALARAALSDLRAGTAVWRRVWHAAEPVRRDDKIRYATAFSYVRVLRTYGQLAKLSESRSAPPPEGTKQP
ncbi:MAG: glycosyltransferase [Actinomycetia bacterium]|nr:glycosyltransferase [Actinomycetes bacterium]